MTQFLASQGTVWFHYLFPLFPFPTHFLWAANLCIFLACALPECALLNFSKFSLDNIVDL